MSGDKHWPATLLRDFVRMCRRSASSSQELSTYRNLVAFLFSSPGSLVPAVLASVLLPNFCWRATDDIFFLKMTIFTAIVSGFRLATLFRYCRVDHASDDWDRTRGWDGEFVLGATIMSAALGYNCYHALTSTSSVATHLAVVAFNVALASGYVARNAARPIFVLIQLVLFSGPIGLGLIASPAPYYSGLGYFAILYIFSNTSVVFSVYRNLIELISTKKEAESLAGQLHRQNLTLDAALNTMPHGMAMFDDNLALCVVNQRHLSLYRVDRRAKFMSLGAMVRELLRTGLVSRAQSHELLRSGRISLKEGRATQIEIATRTGSEFVVGFNPVAEGGVLMTTEDATARRRAEKQIERLARFDTLTALPNRHEFRRRLQIALDKLADSPTLAVMFLDLDGFKRINDTLGHEFGDALLVEVSRRLLRRKHPDLVAGRLGGDEFAAILIADDRESALQITRRIGDALREPFVIHDRSVRISSSIGVAFAPDHGEHPEMLLRHADIAQYRAKASGPGNIAIFDESMARELAERISIEADLRAAAAAKAFEVHYQPIFDLSSGKIVCYEALLRWPHPTRGYLAPSLFIPIAEQTGQIEALGCFVMRRACAEAAEWPPEIGVSINVSLIQFRNPRVLIDCVKESLALNHFDPRRLTLEITESSLIEGMEATIETIEELRALGVRFAMDDFGTGYSSLSHLGNLPFSVVKIDGSLAKDVAHNPTSYAIVEAVCALSKRIGMEVVVEGVETEEQLVAIRLIGASRVQGWLIGKPAPAARLADTRAAVA
jgi:diguanylate cyclase (GGDEF)-like protein